MKRSYFSGLVAACFVVLAAAHAQAEILAMLNYESKPEQTTRKEGLAILDVDPKSPTFGKMLMDIPLPPDLVAHHIFCLIPQGYQAYARQLIESIQSPGLVTTATQVADAIFAAATDDNDQLRFPAGPDSEQLAQARWRSSDEEFLAGLRSMFRMKEVTWSGSSL